MQSGVEDSLRGLSVSGGSTEYVCGLTCSAIFRKMFPEYVEKQLERERESEQAAAEQKQMPILDMSALPEKMQQLVTTDRTQAEMKGRQHRSFQKFPLWLTAVVVAVFASIMALPLLTLDLTHF